MKRPSTNPQINGRPMSFVRLGSRVARWYHGGGFKIRGVTYELMKDGSLSAHGKPRSRVKRLREERSSVTNSITEPTEELEVVGV